MDQPVSEIGCSMERQCLVGRSMEYTLIWTKSFGYFSVFLGEQARAIISTGTRCANRKNRSVRIVGKALAHHSYGSQIGLCVMPTDAIALARIS